MFYTHTQFTTPPHAYDTDTHTLLAYLHLPSFFIFSNFSQRPENLLSPFDSAPPFWGNDSVPSHSHLTPTPPAPPLSPSLPPQSFSDECPLHCMVVTLHFYIFFGVHKASKSVTTH